MPDPSSSRPRPRRPSAGSTSNNASSSSSSSSQPALDRRARYAYDYTNYESAAVVDLTMVEAASGVYYTVPVKLGGTTYHLQPDTGSSDLWVTGNNCAAGACTSVPKYTPTGSSTAHDANLPFTIDYVVGSVSGEIYWEEMEVGGRVVPYQAIAAASNVEDEDLYGGKFSGVIGLALPGNSIINQQLSSPWGLGPLSNLEISPPPPPDGADLSTGPSTWLSRRQRSTAERPVALGSDPPPASAPLDERDLAFTPFISLSLSRPSAPTTPSQIGFDTHLTNLCPAACSSTLPFTTVVESPTGEPLFWRVPIQGIAVTDATGKNTTLSIGASVLDGQAWPVGVLDSGAQGIYSGNRNLLDAIYGSAGIGPGSDGNYYVPCTTAINITIVVSTIGSFPIHPLDVTELIAGDSSHTTCLGALQYIDPAALAGKGDLILGAAFMRNVYTVLSGPAYTRSGTWTTPQLSLLSLTDADTAADEFYRVRVLNQDIPTASSSAMSTPTSTGTGSGATESSKTKVAVIASISVAAVVLLAVAIFVGRFFLVRRKMRKAAGGTLSPKPSDGGLGSTADGSTFALTDASSNKSHQYGLAAPGSPVAYYGDRASGRTTSGSIGSSTAASASLYDTEDEEKAGIAAHAKVNGRQRSPGRPAPRRQVSSLLGGGFEDVEDEEDGKGGLTGSYAPWAGNDDDGERTYDMARISSYDATTPPADARPPSRWTLQASPSRPKGARPTSRYTADAADLTDGDRSSVDRLMQDKRKKRDSRRSRTGSPSSADRQSQASSASNWTLSSSSTLAVANGSGASSGSSTGAQQHQPQAQHSYPPSGGVVRSSSSGSGSLASPPLQTARDRPSLVTYASGRTPNTIVESPTSSPVDADRSFQSLIPGPSGGGGGGRRQSSLPFEHSRGSDQTTQSPFDDAASP